MKVKLHAVIVVIVSLAAGSVNTCSAEGHSTNHIIRLSPDLLDLLRSEMQEIAGGIQGVALSLVTADWESIQETSAKIRASYIINKQLTPAQASELDNALPDQFKQLDADFHQRAERLGAAAAARDPELVVFHYSRLLESCARCHAVFAGQRFPGFASPAPQEHHH